ncbi:hypothetical protein NBRC110019_13130 [Neptunitalea chrysea]|uniref:Uncharacterized protein n=1 Tax=Neptunitalea chrysea TaxID=1647581 RepID=A0A9W6B6Q8_9FLAO|nr:hypothetical protein [Neptunitalea chrysea]GLB52274.1 hypothetical protein NBRC110019_13130 [Neptunitalea chrysea]
MRRFFSIGTVLLTFFCIGTIFYPQGNLSLIISVVALLFSFVLLKLSKTTFKKNLPKVLIVLNILLLGFFIIKQVAFKEETTKKPTVEKEQTDARELKLKKELNQIEKEELQQQEKAKVDDDRQHTIDSGERKERLVDPSSYKKKPLFN